MGVGDGGFSGMIPCLRRISFLQGHQTLPRIDMLISLPLGVFIGVDLDLHRYIWHSRVHFGRDSGRAAACARGRMCYTVSCGEEWQAMRCVCDLMSSGWDGGRQQLRSEGWWKFSGAWRRGGRDDAPPQG